MESGEGMEAAAAATKEASAPASAALPTRPVKIGPLMLDYPLASAVEIANVGGAYTRGALVKVSWKLVTCTFMLSIWGKIDGDIWSPFLFSRVHCCDLHGTGGPGLDGNSASTM